MTGALLFWALAFGIGVQGSDISAVASFDIGKMWFTQSCSHIRYIARGVSRMALVE